MISVGIVTYNSGKYIQALHQSILENIFSHTEIVYIDNNSKDDTGKKIDDVLSKTQKNSRKNALSVVHIKNNQNIGFARAVNQFVARAKYNTIFLVNPDSVVDKECMHRLYNAFVTYKNAVVGGQFVEYGDKKTTSNTFVERVSYFDCMLELTNLGKLFGIVSNFWDRQKHVRHEVAGVSGGCMMFAKTCFQKLGGFDERFFLYLEDVDFCVRAKKAGYTVVAVPDAQIFHEGGGSSTNDKKYDKKSWLDSRQYFFRKNFRGIFQYLLFKTTDIFERVLIFSR